MTFIKNIEGKWSQLKPIPGDNAEHQDGILEALNELDPIFHLAYKRNELHFILTLIRYKKNMSPGWDSLENLRKVIDSYEDTKNKIKNSGIFSHLNLYMYGQIIEASEPYEVIANMLNAIRGDKYKYNNFPDFINPITKRPVPQSPSDKISQLKKWCKKEKLHLTIFDKFIDSKLRNAIYHSDYCIYGGEIRITRPIEIVYSQEELLQRINRAKAYIEVFFRLYDDYQMRYIEPKIIKFDQGSLYTEKRQPITEAVTIIRKNHGIVGLTITPDQSYSGYDHWRIGHFLEYEQDLISKGISLLPENRIKRVNMILKALPRFISKKIVRYLENTKWIRGE